MEMPLQGEFLPDEAPAFRQELEKEDDFHIRRAVERLREGLFDPVAVRLLTAHEQNLRRQVQQCFETLDGGGSAHLCIVGAYGQGKSHSLVYIKDFALREGFVASLINLDPREVPLGRFREVYRQLMARLELPDGQGSFAARWKSWARQQMRERQALRADPAGLLPERMPRFFRAVLAAMANGNVCLSEKEKGLKKHARFRPQEFPLLLARCLEGEAIPVSRMRHVFKYRQVSFLKDGPLGCRGVDPFMEMIHALARLFRQMGYRGWVLLFDEAESIGQANVLARGKSYRLLQRLIAPDGFEPAFVYPVFGFTDDFFERVREEDYEQVRVRGATTVPCFERNYAREWERLNICRLHDLSRQQWQVLSQKLIHLHAKAYGWQPPASRLARQMADRLDALGTQETRLKLKALVDCLDLVHQSSEIGDQNLEPRTSNPWIHSEL
ncbi:MAG: DUF2791 family P-loop domain-containing protein [Desulfobacterales bacterium]|nr:DUF2791 family P-loop domain-containing protein [Desulfobacterales bacterium]